MSIQSTPEITILVGSAEDAGELAKFGEKTFRATYSAQNSAATMRAYVAEHFTNDRLTQEILDDQNLFFIARNKMGKIVGYAKVTESVPDPCVTGPAVEIQRIYVARRSKGKGIGAALLQRCINSAALAGYESTWLGVWVENEKAIAFYRKWGFEVVGTHIFELGGEEQTDYVMQRRTDVDSH